MSYTKPQLFCCPDGLLVKFWDYQAMPNACNGSSPAWGNFAFFFLTFSSLQIDDRKLYLHVFEMYRLQFKIKTAKEHWSVRHYSSVYIAAMLQTVDFISTTNQCSKYKIRQPMLTDIFYLGCIAFLWKGQNLTCLHS